MTADVEPNGSHRIHVHLENSTSKPRPFWLTPELIEAAQLSNPGLEDDVRFTVNTDLEEIDLRLSTATVLVTSSGVIGDPRFPRRTLAEAAPRLKFIHLIDAGVEDVMPLDWLPPNVQLTNNSGVHVAKAREFLIMSLLALNARLPEIVWNQRQARWDQIFTPLIRGKSLLVIGLGDLGQAAVAAGQILGLRISGVRRSGKSVPGVEQVYPPSQLHDALRQADFIVIATPLTAETRNLVDRAALEAAKPGAGLINIGRAGVLDHEALVELLNRGHLNNAILDVLPGEPLPSSSALWSTPNLMINPHVGADDPTSYMTETMQLVFGNLRRHLAGLPLENLVDAGKGY
ncbi:MAG: Phosphoglycerate dehydrogenase [Herbaspirillum sp.]|jgi:phosphoglycerate dehydrogenase-like enzyme|nr:Phosphoglycerate dehydrogenase [Herbaspirillum sp.]